MTRRGVSLIEAVVCVLVLAIAVPPTLELVDSACSSRADSVNTTRATFLAALVIETVIADCASTDPTLGFGALAETGTYLNDPASGLFSRLEQVTGPYTTVGMSYSVDISGLVDATGVVSADPDENIFRSVTVTVRYPSAIGDDMTMPLSAMVGDL